MNEAAPTGTGRLPQNILHFARTLRAAGLPIGPGAVLDAVAAVRAVGFGGREDLRATLHAVFVKKRDQTVVFDQAFDIFWKRRGFLEKMIALMSPLALEQNARQKAPPAGATRVADAMTGARRPEPKKQEIELDMRLSMSTQEVLQRKDFAQMSAEEIAQARKLIARLAMPQDRRVTRRFAPARRGVVDPRRTLRQTLRAGGDIIDLAFRARVEKPPTLVALCDISGSMSDYTRVFLHFLHALTETRRVHTFLFGTRLTNVTRDLRRRDVDEALALCSADVKDWSGGTRIGESLGVFNRRWSRRVLDSGATVLLITDGLERDGVETLAREAERLGKSCRRLIWLNPLLRFEGFQPKAQGVRALLPHVDSFRSLHNLASMRELVEALSRPDGRETAPRRLLDGAA